MELRLKRMDFRQLPEESQYNDNVYTYVGIEANKDFKIREKCLEAFNSYRYFIIEEDKEIFLGDSEDSLYDDEVNIEFRYKCT